MDEAEAKEMRRQLAEHYGEPVMPVSAYCDALEKWAERKEQHDDDDEQTFRDARQVVELELRKSCLLDRIIYCGEGLSQTPCPVHQGTWSGWHGPWPGQMGMNARTGERFELTPSEHCQRAYDAGCRCFMHSCGCTTGWQPDEHCGCGPVQ